MTTLHQFKDHMMFVARYGSPKSHEHLASHVIVSLGETMEFEVAGETINCRGICIGPKIRHKGVMPEEGSLVFLFTETSTYTPSIREQYWKESLYAVIEEEKVNEMIECYQKEAADASKLEQEMLTILGITKVCGHRYDTRIEQVLSYVEELPSIESEIYEDISSMVCLSKSRLSHLFREETNMTLHSYLAFEKFRKTYTNVEQGMPITEACLMAGFASPSHCASTCKRMFGISISEVIKSFKDSV